MFYCLGIQWKNLDTCSFQNHIVIHSANEISGSKSVSSSAIIIKLFAESNNLSYCIDLLDLSAIMFVIHVLVCTI